jgi:hypothetical protein
LRPLTASALERADRACVGFEGGSLRTLLTRRRLFRLIAFGKPKCKSGQGDSKMSWGSDLHRDFEKLTVDAAQMADENTRLRKINAQMLAALEYALPILQQGLPDTVNFDWTKEAIDKIQSVIAEAQSD